MQRFIAACVILLCFAIPAHAGFAKPKSFISGRLICAVNVNQALAERGINGSGSRRALDFLKWGRASGPVPGAVAVRHRKGKGNGHAAIVSRVQSDGSVCVHNPSSRRGGWQEVCGQRYAYYRVQ